MDLQIKEAPSFIFYPLFCTSIPSIFPSDLLPHQPMWSHRTEREKKGRAKPVSDHFRAPPNVTTREHYSRGEMGFQRDKHILPVCQKKRPRSIFCAAIPRNDWKFEFPNMLVSAKHLLYIHLRSGLSVSIVNLLTRGHALSSITHWLPKGTECWT